MNGAPLPARVTVRPGQSLLRSLSLSPSERPEERSPELPPELRLELESLELLWLEDWPERLPLEPERFPESLPFRLESLALRLDESLDLRSAMERWELFPPAASPSPLPVVVAAEPLLPMTSPCLPPGMRSSPHSSTCLSAAERVML